MPNNYGTDKSYRVPEGWRTVPIGEALRFATSAVRPEDDQEYELISIRRRHGGMFHREFLKGRSILTKSMQRVVPGTFVIARRQIVHGACAIAPPEFSNSIMSMSYSSFSGTEICNPGYFFRLAQQPQLVKYFWDASHGVVIEKLNFQQDEWLQKPVTLPPLEEQRRIAEILDTIDETIQATERVIAKLVWVAQASRVDAWEKIRSEWPSSPFGMVATLRSGEPTTRAEAGTFPVYGGNGVNGYTEEPLTRKPTVIIGRVGEYAGATHLTNGPAGITDNALWVTAHAESLSVEYLFEALRQADPSSTQSQTGQPLVTQSGLSSLQIPLPSRQTQESLLQQFNDLDWAIAVERKWQHKLFRLRDGLAADLLSGRVRTVAS